MKRLTFIPRTGRDAAWRPLRASLIGHLPRFASAAAPLIFIMLLSAAVAAQSVAARNQYKVARGFAEKGDWQRAVEFADKALQESPNYVDALYLRGLSHFGLEQYDKAEEDLKAVVTQEPQFFPAYQHLGNLYLVTERYDEAEQHFQKMLMVPKAAPTANYCLGVVAYAKQDLAAAERFWQEALKVDNKMGRARNNLAQLRILGGRFNEAVIEAKEAVRLDPGNALYSLNLGWAYAEGGKLEEARKHLTETQHKADARHDVGFAATAMLAMLDKDYEKVQKLCARAIETNPDLLHAYLLAARAYEKQENSVKARETWLKVKELDPNVAEADKALERLPEAEKADPAGPAEEPGPSEEADSDE